VTSNPPKLESRLALWISLIVYLVALLATGMAGPYWALLLWTILAFPQFWDSAVRNSREGRSRGWSMSALVVLAVWITIVLLLPLLTVVFHLRVTPPASFKVPLGIVTLGLPVFVTILLLRWEYVRRAAR
jgi:hypothetical protein